MAQRPSETQTGQTRAQQQETRQAKALQRVVFRAFPEADAYRRITRDLDQTARTKIEARLPFKVHFNELGTHCLLVAFRGRRPVGIIYRRTEETDWGLTEIAWHLALDRRVVGFRFLLGRNRHISDLERSALATSIAGSDFGKILAQLRDHERRDHKGRKASLVSLERITLRSAAKALALIDAVWQSQIERLHDQATGFDLFPAASRFTRRSGPLDVREAGQERRYHFKVLYAYDLSNTFLGCVAWTTSPAQDNPTVLRWTISRNLHVIALQARADRPPLALRKACSELKGRLLSAPGTRSVQLAPLARSLATVILKFGDRSMRR